MKTLALLALWGCGLDMSEQLPWVSADEILPPLIPELLQPTDLGPVRMRPTATTQPVRVVTYNVQYGPDIPAIAAAIESTPALASAGVFLIQEIESYGSEPSSRAKQLADLLGLGYVYVPAREVPGGTHGLAILSAFPITAVEKMDLRQAANASQHRIAIQATIDVDGHPLDVINVHLDTKLSAKQRIAQLSPIVVDAPPATLVGGDFNMCWVVWVDGSVPVLSSSGATDQALVVDSYMRAVKFETPTADSGPTEHMFGLEQRLDAIYTRGHAVQFGGVERVGPSDHWPMWVDVTLQ